MILGASKIIELIKEGVEVEDKNGKQLKKPLIEGLGEDQIAKIEGTTVDLRLAEVLQIEGGAELFCQSRTTPRIRSVMSITDPERIYTLGPEEIILVQTVETINLPHNLLADVRNRTTLFRCGLYLKTAYISPNYQGVLTFGMKNLSTHPVRIEMGFRIACVSFMEINGDVVPYHGVWQGKRASTDGEVERPF
jgi:deoxycytidine triphosphate deaminase